MNKAEVVFSALWGVALIGSMVYLVCYRGQGGCRDEDSGLVLRSHCLLLLAFLAACAAMPNDRDIWALLLFIEGGATMLNAWFAGRFRPSMDPGSNAYLWFMIACEAIGGAGLIVRGAYWITDDPNVSRVGSVICWLVVGALAAVAFVLLRLNGWRLLKTRR